MSGLIGAPFGQTPSSAKLMTVAPPTMMAMPSVCMNRYIGNAQSEPDSRIQVPYPVASMLSRNCTLAIPFARMTGGAAVDQQADGDHDRRYACDNAGDDGHQDLFR